jgi:conjugal transfer pilus assembly protein TraB
VNTIISTAKIRAHASKIFKGLIATFFVIGLLLFWLSTEKPPVPKETLNEKAPIYDLTKAVDDKSLWMFKAQNQLLEQQKVQEKLTQELEELKKNTRVQIDMEAIQTRLEQLEQKASTVNATLSSEASSAEPLEQSSFKADPAQTLYVSSNEYPSPTTQNIGNSIFSENLALSVNEQNKLPHIDSFIPPGTYAKAKLLNGVDVSAGVSSQATPKPVLLRLIHRGSLPNKAVGHMKDCRIIAAAYGDLSSERAYMRLEKLSCVQPNGHVIVTDVDGYVNGEDGKNGLRGKVVIRDAEVLTRGFMGGLLSGLGKTTSQSYRSTSISPFGTMNTLDAKGVDFLKQAGAQGVGDAFELMAKYNIQRAEQYQPVIQISADREVDVVFHSGSQFGEKKNRKPSNHPSTQSISTHPIDGD